MFLRLTDRLEVDMEHGIPPMIPSSNSNSQQEQEENNELLSILPSLTWQERLGGCLACMALGYILSLGSFFRFRDLLHGNPTSFVSYTSTVGTIISLSGSCFLSGPKSQLEKMFHDSRKMATILYLGSLVLTLVVAFLKEFRGQAFIVADFGGCAVCGCVLVLSFVYSFCEADGAEVVGEVHVSIGRYGLMVMVHVIMLD
mmetsp:Transcript_12042/g.18080  ORF Transcript_12042/g.18080 Transcript_12042/m.18080 type:complete len:200 (-) Transcript_12042:193-792(-)